MLNIYLWNLMILSFTAVVLYAVDKHLAKNQRGRIPEMVLICVSVLGGVLGSLLGMVLFNHKANISRKWYFLCGILAALFIQVSILLLLLDVLHF